MVVYQAPLVILAIVVTYFFRTFTNDGKIWRFTVREPPPKINIWCRYWTWLLLFIIWLNLVSLMDMNEDIMAQSGWLDPNITETFVNQSLTYNGELGTKFKEWKDEASLEEYQWLRWFSIFCPFWVICTIVACAWHIYTHIVKIQEAEAAAEEAKTLEEAQERKVQAQLHDMTVLILFLPLFYSTMSFKSVMRMWQVCIDHVGALGNGNATSGVHKFSGYEERRDFVFEMYEANFLVGDVYETFALVVFGRLVTRVLAAHVRDAKWMLPSDDTSGGGGGGNGKPPLPPPIHGRPTPLDLGATRLFIWGTSLMITGIQWFNVTCVTQAIYQCTLTQLGLMRLFPNTTSTDPHNLGSMQEPAVKDEVAAIFLGCGFVSSFVAIGNIMTAEGEFHAQLHHFRPSGKFWGTKILVSLAFIQTLVLKVLPPFSHYTEPRLNLFYASLLTFECFGITLLHVVAWGADEDWYLPGAEKPKPPDNLREYLLHHE